MSSSIKKKKSMVQDRSLTRNSGRILSFGTRYGFAAASCLYLFTVGSLYPRNRSLIRKICSHFRHHKAAKADNRIPEIVPTINLSELIRETILIQVQDPVGVEGNPPPLELLIINGLIRANAPRRLFEIGTFDGRTTVNMALNCPPEAEIFTLDLPEGAAGTTAFELDPSVKLIMGTRTIGAKYSGSDCRRKIKQLCGDSATYDYSSFFNSVDFIFIDGAHSYEYVLSDSRNALRLLRNRAGVILWHNYGKWWPGVVRALNELYLEGREFAGLKRIQETNLAYLRLE
jgi:predicted O-methyltransferase YrrM